MALGDLLRPKWKHSNPEVRLEAVAELTDQDGDKLTEIATTDEDPKIRLAAVARIDDQAILEQIAATDTDGDVLDALTVKIDQHLRSTVLDSSDAATYQPILERISCEDVLSSIVVDTEHDDIRIENIDHSCQGAGEPVAIARQRGLGRRLSSRRPVCDF